MDSDTLKFLANFLAKKVAAWAAGSLVTIGALQSGEQGQFVTMASGIIVGLLAFIWSWWNDRGKQAVLAELAKAHGIVPQTASTAAASNALTAKVNNNTLVPTGTGAVKIVGVLLIGLLVLHAMPASAQTKTTATTTAKPIPCDPLALIPGCTPTAASAALATTSTNLQTLWNQIVSATDTDLAYAIALANNVNSPGSKLRSICYQAILVANQQANGATLKDASGNPLAKPNPAALSTFEQGAELVDNLGATAPVMSACAAAANAVAQSTTQLISTMLASVALKAAVPIP